jgi:hypothetical protein
MGVSLALVLIDHENVVARGLPVLSSAITAGDAAPLREFLRNLPFETNAELTRYYGDRLARLRAFEAPPMIIEAEERRLATMAPPTEEFLASAGLEDLRLLLGRWCSEARAVDLDKSWDLIHWYCDPERRQRAHGDWRFAQVVAPSPLDLALHGLGPYPTDCTGAPVIRTGGNVDGSYYNPPAVVAQIHEALQQVNPQSWQALDRDLEQLAEENRPYLWDADRLEYAGAYFDQLASCYQQAAARGFGVSCEFY